MSHTTLTNHRWRASTDEDGGIRISCATCSLQVEAIYIDEFTNCPFISCKGWTPIARGLFSKSVKQRLQSLYGAVLGPSVPVRLERHVLSEIEASLTESGILHIIGTKVNMQQIERDRAHLESCLALSALPEQQSN